MDRSHRLGLMLAPLALFSAGGCASIVHGTRQRVEVITAPEGATASADGQTVRTPGVLTLPRKSKALEIRIEKEGFATRLVQLVRATSGAVWWNFVEIPVGLVAGASAGYSATKNEGGWFAGLEGAAYGGAAGGAGLTGVGFAIDYSNGAAYRLEPAKVIVRLEPLDAALSAPISGGREKP